MSKKIFIFSGLILLFLPQVIFADGLFLPPIGNYVQETDQKAVIFYEKDKEAETLVISTKYKGNAEDFAWIIPVPGEPEITRGSYNLFNELVKKTTVPTTYQNVALGSSTLEFDSSSTMPAPVEVVETKTIDYYDIAVLKSTDNDALASWLTDNGYQYPENKAYIFNEYINNGWFFIAMKINPEYAESEVNSSLYSGTATPIQLTFQTKNIIYPLRLSSIAQDIATSSHSTSVPITLYVFAKNKQQATNFNVQYADKMKKDDIMKLANQSNGDPWITPKEGKYFLTKLYGSLQYTQMNEDLFLKDAEDNKVVNNKKSNFNANIFARFILMVLLFMTICILIAIFSPLGLVYYYLARKKGEIKTWRKILMWVDYGLIVIVLLALQRIAIDEDVYRHLDDFLHKSYYTENAFAVASWLVGAAILIIIPIINIRMSRKKISQP